MVLEPLELLVNATFGGPQPGAFGHPGIRADITADEIAAAQARLGTALPEALREYYAVAGKYDGMMGAHCSFLPPGDLHVEEGHVVFCHENQHVMEWGVRLDDIGLPNPPVYGHMTDGPDAGMWAVESTTLSAFLLGVGSWQAVLSGEESAECELPEDELLTLGRWFAPVGEPDLRHGGPLVGYVDPDRWMVAAYDMKHAMLYVGTSAEGGLEDLEQRSGLELDWY